MVLACVLGLLASAALAQNAAEISQLRIDRAEDQLQLSAQLNFDLPTVVEDALLKGIPMVFVMTADIARERWYWYDKKIVANERHMRLAWQALTRRWRLNVSSGPGAANTVGLALNQSYDSLADAMAAIKRVNKWRIADTSELEQGVRYRAEFRFRLDLTQLPRPFQIGALGQSEWDIAAATATPIMIEPLK